MAPVRILGLHWDDVCAPWRVQGPLRALRRLGLETRTGSMLQPPDLDSVDVLLMHRPMTPEHLTTIDEAQYRGIAVVVDVDDLFQEDALPPAGYGRTWHSEYDRRQAEAKAASGAISPAEAARTPRSARIDLLREALGAADAVTVTTPALAEAYARWVPDVRRLAVLPNCYDDVAPLWRAHRLPGDGARIGFAGSDYQLDNVALLRGALEPVLAAHPDASVVEAGGPTLLPEIDAPPEQLVFLGTVPFGGFPLLLAQMDIVLAPLADTPFMRAKSNIRCLTAGLARAPVVASPMAAYADYVRDGENGFLARTTAEWTDRVGRLVADPDLRARMGIANRRRAADFALSTNAWRWTDLYDSLLDRRRAA